MSALDIISVDGTLVVSSETIAEGTGTQHKNVLELIESNRADFGDFGRVAFETRSFATAGGAQSRRVALLSEPQATLLMTFMRNIGPVKEFKKALVKAFFEMAAQIIPYSIPQTYAAALELAALQARQLEANEAELAAAAPKVLFADSVATSNTSILVSELAKILKGNGVQIGGTRLFTLLREEGYLIKRAGSDWNMPTQKAMELGLFKVKETAVTHSDGHVTVSKTPKVTGKGQSYFVNRYTKLAA